MAIAYDSNSITVYRTGSRKKTIYLSENDTIRLSVHYDKAFPAGSVLTVTWATAIDGNTDVTLASQTDTLLASEIYLTAADGTDNARTVVKCTAVSDSGETLTVSFDIYHTLN